ncbi:MAG TPA: hypothetical protein PKZ99_07225 [Azospirillaceae bacterium]|nr:hypothetical protein [Azospirillaceae bacterium]
MTAYALLRIRFTHYWLSGSGASGGRYADAVALRDADAFPAMPMSQIKGTLRETAERLAAGGQAGWNPALVTRLFGYRPRMGETAAPPKDGQGALRFPGQARLPTKDRNPDRKPDLFQPLAATRIDKYGVADNMTLRAVEAAKPLILEGRVEWNADFPEPADTYWPELIDAACAATLAFGKLKTDGYGRAVAWLEVPQ